MKIIKNILLSLNVSSAAAARLNPADELTAAYRQGYQEALQTVAVALGIPADKIGIRPSSTPTRRGVNMLYIQIDVTLIDHPKLKKLARLLGVSRVAAVGHLAALWAWAAQYAPDGDLTTYLDEPEALADAAMWEGDPRTFFDALVGARFGDGVGFLEVTVEGALRPPRLERLLRQSPGTPGRQRRTDAPRARAQRAQAAPVQAPPPIPEDRARTQPAQPATRPAHVRRMCSIA